MASREEMQMHQAQINRSIRTIKAELEYLCDASVISPATLSDLLGRVPAQTALHAPISVGAVPNASLPSSPPSTATTTASSSSQPTVPIYNPPPPTNEKSQANNSFYAPPPPRATSPLPAYSSTPTPQQPGPAGPPPPPEANWAAPPPLAQASAMYVYSAADEGDLELQPNDRIVVTEYMNAEWWKGRNTRTGREGIFPRSYVQVLNDEKAPLPPQNSGYGNLPLDVSQGGGYGNGAVKPPSKFEENTKKFGRKLGNAAIFGAGATLGSDLVNSII